MNKDAGMKTKEKQSDFLNCLMQPNDLSENCFILLLALVRFTTSPRIIINCGNKIK